MKIPSTLVVPIVLATGLLLTACGSGTGPQAIQAPAATPTAAATSTASPIRAAEDPRRPGRTYAPIPRAASVRASAPGSSSGGSPVLRTPTKTVHREAKARPALGASDRGVTADQIRLGTINMHSMPLARIAITPLVQGILGTASAINDRGGVLGRRLQIVDCDSGAGDVARSKNCVAKLVDQDRIFSLVTGADWGSASIHDDVRRRRLPYVGVWAYSQTEWQDPWMFPTHMSMLHEAMAGGRWVRDVIKPKTYGLLCLNSPEMQRACSEVARILDAAGSRMVKKIDLNVSDVSMSSYVLAMRAAAPEHVVHYVMNPAMMAKFIVESAQQGYWPPQGISGNHLAAELLGSILGPFPEGRYWTNTTYRLWGPEFVATMNRYARGSAGRLHHLIQVAHTGVNIFAAAAREVGPDLTRERLVAVLGNRTWKSDASLDQTFTWSPAERGGTAEHPTWSRNLAQGRQFMYRYVSANTRSNPDGSPSGLVPDDRQFVIRTHD